MSQLLPVPGKVYMLKHIKLPVSSSTRTIVVPGGPSEPLRDFHPNIVESLFSRKVSDGEKQSQETSIWSHMESPEMLQDATKGGLGRGAVPQKAKQSNHVAQPFRSLP